MKQIIKTTILTILEMIAIISIISIKGYCQSYSDFVETYDFGIGTITPQGQSVINPLYNHINASEYSGGYSINRDMVIDTSDGGKVLVQGYGLYDLLFHESTYEEIVHPAGTYYYHCDVCGMYYKEKHTRYDDEFDPLHTDPIYYLECGHTNFTEGTYDLQEWTEWNVVSFSSMEKEFLNGDYERSILFSSREELSRYRDEESKFWGYVNDEQNRFGYGILPQGPGETNAYNSLAKDTEHPFGWLRDRNNNENNTANGSDQDEPSDTADPHEANNNSQEPGSVTSTKLPSQPMIRFYNPNSGEHFYTGSFTEAKNLDKIGWVCEGIGFLGSTEGSPVYRLYNPNAGDHHYTTSEREKNNLVKTGWNYEGIAWTSAPASTGEPVYRLYNPNATGAGSHHYTTSEKERKSLESIGWKFEGVAWYQVRSNEADQTAIQDCINKMKTLSSYSK